MTAQHNEPNSDPDRPLLALMREIDALDDALVSLLRRRFEASRMIGDLKKARGYPKTDPNRIASQRLSFIGKCTQATLNEDMASKLIDVIVQQVIAERS